MTELELGLRERRAGLVAIDGYHGSGKTTVARQLSAALGIQVLHVDDFLDHAQGTFASSIRYPDLSSALQVRPIIVEGVCILEIAARLGVSPDVHVYVHDRAPAADSVRGSGALALEVASYHRDYRPLERADIVFYTLRSDPGATTMDASRADVDIAFIQAKTKLALFLAGGGMLTLAIGLAVLLYGATGDDQTLIKAGMLEVSASGLGGVIMATSVVWAFLAYKARPTYSRTRQSSEEYDAESRLLRRYEQESATQQAVSPKSPKSPT